ncbi:MAG: serine kinase [Synergistaceae bacterium]|jgi:hypothetical protein|nr:serine kinase [Synergistaceae bacterium]
MKTTGELCSALALNVICPGDPARPIENVIVGDLLSHILGEARENWAWVTIQVHLNVAAVAVLKELPLVILASNRAPQEDLTAKCAEENIALATTPLGAYELCCRLGALGVGNAGNS